MRACDLSFFSRPPFPLSFLTVLCPCSTEKKFFLNANRDVSGRRVARSLVRSFFSVLLCGCCARDSACWPGVRLSAVAAPRHAQTRSTNSHSVDKKKARGGWSWLRAVALASQKKKRAMFVSSQTLSRSRNSTHAHGASISRLLLFSFSVCSGGDAGRPRAWFHPFYGDFFSTRSGILVRLHDSKEENTEIARPTACLSKKKKNKRGSDNQRARTLGLGTRNKVTGEKKGTAIATLLC